MVNEMNMTYSKRYKNNLQTYNKENISSETL